LRAILRFEEGNKVKITLRFRGREMAHQQLGLAQLQKLKLTLLSLVLLNKRRKWKVVKWACYLVRKRKSNFSLEKAPQQAVLFYVKK
jgi:translation initiation factor IF-3